MGCSVHTSFSFIENIAAALADSSGLLGDGFRDMLCDAIIREFVVVFDKPDSHIQVGQLMRSYAQRSLIMDPCSGDNGHYHFKDTREQNPSRQVNEDPKQSTSISCIHNSLCDIYWK